MGIIKYFATDKYAIYIWGSYSVAFILMATEVLMLLKRKRNLARRRQPQHDSRESGLQTSFQETQ